MSILDALTGDLQIAPEVVDRITSKAKLNLDAAQYKQFGRDLAIAAAIIRSPAPQDPSLPIKKREDFANKVHKNASALRKRLCGPTAAFADRVLLKAWPATRDIVEVSAVLDAILAKIEAAASEELKDIEGSRTLSKKKKAIISDSNMPAVEKQTALNLIEQQERLLRLFLPKKPSVAELVARNLCDVYETYWGKPTVNTWGKDEDRTPRGQFVQFVELFRRNYTFSTELSRRIRLKKQPKFIPLLKQRGMRLWRGIFPYHRMMGQKNSLDTCWRCSPRIKHVYLRCCPP
jgi:hypothetical protein